VVEVIIAICDYLDIWHVVSELGRMARLANLQAGVSRSSIHFRPRRQRRARHVESMQLAMRAHWSYATYKRDRRMYGSNCNNRRW